LVSFLFFAGPFLFLSSNSFGLTLLFDAPNAVLTQQAVQAAPVTPTIDFFIFSKLYYEFSRKYCGLLSLPKTGFGTSKSYQPHIPPFNDALYIWIVVSGVVLLSGITSPLL
jgi:hypothetical protein